MPIVEGLEQQTPDWFKMRCGMVTGSRVAEIMAKLKAGGKNGLYAQSRENYKRELVCARLTGLNADHYVTAAMQWGTENEKYARARYEIDTGNIVNTIGFAMHPKIKWFGASPDGVIGAQGLLEIKCPTTRVHVDTLLSGRAGSEYEWQMYAEMACAEREWCDFVSFDPRIEKEDLQIFVKRYHRNDAKITELEAEVVQFLSEVDGMLAGLPGVLESLTEAKAPSTGDDSHAL